MKSSVFLFSSDIPELLAGSDPQTMAAAHPVWKQTMERWGPWRKSELSGAQMADEHLVLRSWTGERDGPGQVFLVRSCSSALDLAWKLMQWDVLAQWDAVIAVEQWSGRGQVRRPWQSLPGNLHLVWRAPTLPKPWDGLTSLVPAWLAARSLGRFGFDVRLKWPNDLVLEDRKIGGILAEQRGETVVVGLGLNLAAVPEQKVLRENAAMEAGSLDGRISPAMCWEQLVSESRSWYQNVLPELRPDDFVHLFSDMLIWKNREISILDHAHDPDALHGRLLGITPDGSLLVSCPEGVRRIASGEVRLVS
ncbi:BirA family transcriptional regulator, biotin operon repressor / biotin-[acetyl-CoA-carboxylase] ligase [Desulfonatronum thiosulfatophilum]|uniref:biotin--[biotin carboxyl-carrier protein] ligase n=1 Tax=Desulfonatronum thiosulfatophilum TaxID=617002 RepID=A0A1G6ENM3_9BACT|nr:biotin--[acetyl-CoA-carboxylase] ligase [Desulfonatronum thiosulfatophilum]SDB59099.1 BirA family transcriptional regulator, biotin operon repressor / biotin-[acetyl-CoA-carboxylase] ligase [Desulfonatronum thiosulfatophilum]